MMYLIWIDRPANTFKRAIKASKGLNQALQQYVRDLPEHVRAAGKIEELRYERVERCNVVKG